MSTTTFSSQTLTEKLSNLNATQQSIETLSHWCIFHRKKAKLIVETWRKLFNSSAQEQKISFLYLANDILQNSRRKGSEYVYEFWKVLPEALKSACENGDDHVKSVVMRLVGIWDERKVFGSRVQGLKDDILGKAPPPPENNGKSSAPVKAARIAHSVRIKLAAGGRPEKIVTAYQSVQDEHFNEDAALNNCKVAVLHVGKMEKEVDGACTEGIPPGSSLMGEVEEQETCLKQCIQQLESVEAIRANLISQLKEALQEQESKQELIHNQLQVARAETERTVSMKQRIASAMIISTGQGPITIPIPSTANLPSQQPASTPPRQPLEPVSPFANPTISPLAQQSQPLSPFVNSFSSPPPPPVEPTTYFANSTSSPRPPPPQPSMPFANSFSAPLTPFANSSSSPLRSHTLTSFTNVSHTQHPQPSPPPPPLRPSSHTFSSPPPQPSQPVTSFASTLSPEEQHKKAVADMAAKLAASTSSAQMLTSVLSSLAAEEAASKNVGFGNSLPTKRSKLEKPTSDISNAFFGQMPPPLQSNRPPPPFPPLPLPPPPMQQYVQTSGTMPGMLPYSFGGNAFPQPPMPMAMGPRPGAPQPPLPPVPPPQQQGFSSSQGWVFREGG